MAQVDVTINGRDYRIACEDGQEQHLIGLASHLNARVAELVRDHMNEPARHNFIGADLVVRSSMVRHASTEAGRRPVH